MITLLTNLICDVKYYLQAHKSQTRECRRDCSGRCICPARKVQETSHLNRWLLSGWHLPGNHRDCPAKRLQRLYFAASTEYPQTIWASRTGDYKDFGKSNPTQDDDRIVYTYAGRQVNEIRHLIDVGSLVVLTFRLECQELNQ